MFYFDLMCYLVVYGVLVLDLILCDDGVLFGELYGKLVVIVMKFDGVVEFVLGVEYCIEVG